MEVTLRDLILAGADVWLEPDETVYGRGASSGAGYAYIEGFGSGSGEGSGKGCGDGHGYDRAYVEGSWALETKEIYRWREE